MIDPRGFYETLDAHGVGFYAGVPDSLLAHFCAYVDDQAGREKHFITVNEGNAVALAMGFHLSTGKIAAVYMQNSGLGNAVNPLASLTDPEVYQIPMLLIIGWRGEPGIKDEPQHVKQGRITLEQLSVLGIPYWTLEAGSDVKSVLDSAFKSIHERNAPAALVVKKDTFSKYKPKEKTADIFSFSREDALEEILKLSNPNDLIVSTTGKTSREVFELRVKHQQPQRDFLTVGGMGHTSSIALGVALGQPNRRVICLDGDGSLLMHMGAMVSIADIKPLQFIHVLLNNGSHESVGGQSTSAPIVDFEMLSKSVGYAGYGRAIDLAGLQKSWRELSLVKGPVLLEVKIMNGSRDDLGRPTTSPQQNKRSFMEAAGV